ncbi:MAG TPA: YeeE/YedE thiosulfate transporter family protein [Vicinamibacterales bacterium]
MNKPPRPYTDPYLAGVGVGLVLLGAYVVVGQGLGASGAFASVVASATAVVQGPEQAKLSAAVAPYLPRGVASPLEDWLVVELVGVILGGFSSAWVAGRVRRTTERGDNLGVGPRLLAAVCGGALMGVGAKFARGCTSGQALSGGALLSVGSWTFIAACFAAGYALAPAARRLWR